MVAIAYLRRSRVDTRKPGAISHEQQLAAVRTLAASNGDDPDALLVIEDWGKSGRVEKEHLRDGFARIEAMVTSGEASAIYSYSANRLARSLETLARLAKACEAAGVPIRCADGYSPDVTTATGRMVLGILGSVYAWQADWTSERMKEAVAIRKANNQHVGPAEYGSRVVDGVKVPNPAEAVADVVAAYREAGGIQGAARLLTVRGVPTRSGKPWAASTVRTILEREAPEVLPVRRSKGRTSSAFRFSGLLVCPHDGARLTGRTFRGRYVAYACRKAPTDPTHPHPYTVAEPAILEWARAEAAHLAVPFDAATDAEPADRDAYEAHRRRVLDNYEDGHISRDERDAKLEAIAADYESRAVRLYVAPPVLDWDGWSAERMNATLRALWSTVTLDVVTNDDRPRLVAVSADWLVPEWRADSATS